MIIYQVKGLTIVIIIYGDGSTSHLLAGMLQEYSPSVLENYSFVANKELTIKTWILSMAI